MFKYELIYRLKEQMSFTGSHTFEIFLNASSKDSTLVISPCELRFTVSRKRKVNLPKHASSESRIRLLGNTLLLLSAASTVAPQLDDGFQIIEEGKVPMTCPLPAICSLWPSSYGEGIISLDDLPYFFSHDGKAKAVRSSLSHLIESKHNGSQAGRRRLLWTSFNALYSHLSSSHREFEKLNDISNLIFNSTEMFPRAIECLRQGMSHGYPGELPWRSITEKIGRDIQGNGRAIISSMDQRVARIYASRLSSKENTREIKQLVQNSLADLDEANDAKALAFLITRYLYSIRNASFHGETPYPVYPHSERRAHDLWIEDLLEATILDLISSMRESA